jgi:hypothetical protein
MTNEGEETLERRQWLIRIGRSIILGGISLLSLSLVTRSLASGCVRLTTPCQTCALLKRCVLPRAERSRQSQSEERA